MVRRSIRLAQCYNRALGMSVVPLSSASRPSVRTVGAHDALAPGSGALQFEKVRGTTVLTRAAAASPLRLLHPKNAGSAAWVYTATYGGGLLGGDAISLDVAVGGGARALMSTQASTKVYRSDAQTTQRMQAYASDESLLVLLPDPVTPFARSRYAQEQHLDIARSATLVSVDWMTAGRVAFGERWQFTSYSSRTRLRRDGRLVLHDATLLDPQDGDAAQRMGRFTCVAWAIAIGPEARGAAIRLASSLAGAPVPKRADVLLSAAPLDDDGVLLRVAGTTTQQVGAVLKQHLSFVPSLLGDDPWATKL
jgi:urease accessory protein